MTLNLGIIKSKILKQSSDITNKTCIIDSHIFNYGIDIIVNDIIIDKFTKVDNTVPTLYGSPSGSLYYIDAEDSYKLKDNYNNIVSDGYYKLKCNINIIIGNSEWKNNNYYLYKIINGLPNSFASIGYYVDLINNILIYINETNIISNASSGYFYYDNPYSLFYCNLYSKINLLKDGLYIISFKNSKIDTSNIIYKIDNNITTIYDGYFININNDKYYFDQKLLGTCVEGSMITCDDKILIRGKTNWKYSNLFDLKL